MLCPCAILVTYVINQLVVDMQLCATRSSAYYMPPKLITALEKAAQFMSSSTCALLR